MKNLPSEAPYKDPGSILQNLKTNNLAVEQRIAHGLHPNFTV